MNIVITGYALSGYGGMETVCKRLVELIAVNNPGTKVDFVFFNEKGEVDEQWYAGLNARMVASTVRNTKLRRLHFALALSGFLRRRQKRLKDLLDSLVALQGEWRLHVVGDGADLFQCQQYAEKLGFAGRVLWHGWQARPWLYAKTNIGDLKALVLTSAFEGLPMTLLEAMAHGVYCVSSDCPTGPADVIDGINGRLYPVKQQAELTKILQGL
uniref:Glycosyl transferase family 1 domain-containing protein n=1 Tax=Anopheles maculatus TaxID=74869 RepID=A0A182SZJ6_9DIPT